MSEILAVQVHFVHVKNNFVHLHSNILNKFRSARNAVICVEVQTGNRSYYCSCNSTPLNINGENALNISPFFAESLGLRELDAVIILEAKHLTLLETVFVTPLCSDDWNIVENCAETIQSTLLNQIRVVSIHQILTIWVSKSFSTKVHVDKIDEGENSGILQLYTKVIVSPNPMKCDGCNQSLISRNTDTSQNIWDFLKDVFSFATKNENAGSTTEENQNSLDYAFIGIFRCVSCKPLILNFPSKLYDYPYNIFVSKTYLKNINHEFPHEDVICRLTSIPFISNYASKNLQPTDSFESVDFFSGQPSLQCFVFLHVVDDNFVADKVTFDALNCYPSIFISKALQISLNLKVNSKVKLDIVCSRKIENKITEINYQILNLKDCYDQEDIETEIKNELSSYAKRCGKLILNNYSVFPMVSTSYVLYVTFNPANQPFVELDIEAINICNFRLVSREIDMNWIGALEENANLNIVTLNFFVDMVQKVKVHLLLKLGVMRPTVSPFIETNDLTLLQGDAGTGKTTILELICGDISQSSYSIFTKKICCKSLKGKMIPKLKKIMENALLECVHFQPAVLFLDDLDVLFYAAKESRQERSESGTSYSLRLSHTISDVIRLFSKYNVTVLATAKDISCFENCIYGSRGASLFSNSLRIPILDQKMREESLVQFLSHKSNIVVPDSIFAKENLLNVVERLNGYCIQDISDLVDRICFEAIKRELFFNRTNQKPQICNSDLDDAISAVIPVSLKGIDFYKNSTVSWKDVGGLNNAKQLLMEILIWPARYPRIFEQCPLKMQSGVLLFGIPGSGKTLLASAVAGESGLNFISIKGPELLSKFVGASEEGIRNTFRKAENAKPCILFFDEFDSLAPRRGNDITGATDRVVNQLLTELDGVEAVSGVWTLASTSRPDLIDPALLRPGRLGTLIHCPLPNQDERLSILKVMSASMELSDDVNLYSIASVTEGFTGADLRALLYSAFTNANKLWQLQTRSNRTSDSLREDSLNNLNPLGKINMSFLMEAAREMKPSLKEEERKQYEKIYRQFQQNEENSELILNEQRLTYA